MTEQIPLYKQSKWLQLGAIFFIIYVAAADFFTRGPEILQKREAQNSKILKEGLGRTARCGDMVNFRYSKALPEISLFLGSSSISRELTKGIEGMRVGEIKEIESPRDGKIEKFHVELTALEPQIPPNLLDLHYSDAKIGPGKEASCGDDVIINFIEYSESGVASGEGEENVAFTLGAGEVPAGFDGSISGMHEGGERIVTIPPHFHYTTSDSPILTMDNDGVLSVKITLTTVK